MTMMNIVELTWERGRMEDLRYGDDAHFYAFSIGSRLEYVGIAYYQDVANEVSKTLLAFDLDSDELVVWLAFIKSTDYERITEQIVKDVECLLIFTNKPSLNTQCMSSYAGRYNLTVKSKGLPLIKACVKVERGYIYGKCS